LNLGHVLGNAVSVNSLHGVFAGAMQLLLTSTSACLTSCVLTTCNVQAAAACRRALVAPKPVPSDAAAAKHAAMWEGDSLACARKPMSRLEREQEAWKAAAAKEQGGDV
jgi:hypothetical protein